MFLLWYFESAYELTTRMLNSRIYGSLVENGAVLIDYIARLAEKRAFLIEDRALLIEYWAVWIECRALWWNVGLFLLDEGLFWKKVGLYWWSIGHFPDKLCFSRFAFLSVFFPYHPLFFWIILSAGETRTRKPVFFGFKKIIPSDTVTPAAAGQNLTIWPKILEALLMFSIKTVYQPWLCVISCRFAFRTVAP